MNIVKKKHPGLVPPIEDFCECNQEAIVYVAYTKKSFCRECHRKYLGDLWS